MTAAGSGDAPGPGDRLRCLPLRGYTRQSKSTRCRNMAMMRSCRSAGSLRRLAGLGAAPGASG